MMVLIQAIPPITCGGCKASRRRVVSRPNALSSIGAPYVLTSLAFRTPHAGQDHLKEH
jgi:hypothetical protein